MSPDKSGECVVATPVQVAGPPSPPAPLPRAGEGRWQKVAIGGLLVGLVLGALWWFDPAATPLPLCSFYAQTGLYCPGCGGTRATHEMLHGHWARALHDNALWALGWPLFSYVALSELALSWRGRPLPGNLSRRRGFWIAVAVVALVFGILRNLPGEPWNWLAPLGLGHPSHVGP